MESEIKLTVLIDNRVVRGKFLAEQGFSILVETADKKILFDTGQTSALIHNSKILSVNLKNIDLVVLSHGHYDHVGGLPYLLESLSQVDIYAHPDILDQRYAQDADKQGLRELGLTWKKEDLERKGAIFHFSREPWQLADNILLTGEIPRSNKQEAQEGDFFKFKNKHLVKDPLLDDQALIIKTRLGLVVVLGCSHAGVINTLDYVSQLTGGEKIHAVVGGMHLGQATKKKVTTTIEGLKNLGIAKVVPLHCTGFKACAQMFFEMDNVFVGAEVGSILRF